MTDPSTPSEAVFDLNEDSVPDTVAVDTNADNVADALVFDLDEDSVPDAVVVDTNADGVADAAFVLEEDTPADPVQDTDAPAATDETDLADDSFTPPEEVTDDDLAQAQADLDHTEAMGDYAASNIQAAGMDLS